MKDSNCPLPQRNSGYATDPQETSEWGFNTGGVNAIYKLTLLKLFLVWFLYSIMKFINIIVLIFALFVALAAGFSTPRKTTTPTTTTTTKKRNDKNSMNSITY